MDSFPRSACQVFSVNFERFTSVTRKKHAKFSEKQTRVRIIGKEMFVLRKISRALFSCNTRFEIFLSALLLRNYFCLLEDANE